MPKTNLPKPYKWPTKKRSTKPQTYQPVNRVEKEHFDEQLTGFINGLEASDLEERFAKSLQANRHRFSYEVEIPTAYSLPGQEKKIDFIVDDFWPVEIDGDIGHTKTEDKQYDRQRELILNPILASQGLHPIVRIKQSELETQDLANQKVLELF